MRKLNVVIIPVLFLTGCAKKQRLYYAGPRGGCYYVTGEKQLLTVLCAAKALALENLK
jgi:hypothetical protein